MSQLKRNLNFIGWALCSVTVICVACGYLYSKWTLNHRKLDELKQTYAENRALNDKEAQQSAQEMGTGVEQTGQRVVADALNITFRAVGRGRLSPEANVDTALEVLNEIKGSPFFDAGPDTKAVGLTEEVPLTEGGKSTGGELPGTFSFQIVAKLKRPLTL